jgi:TRAP-type C4-dicarboxylate transport system substrate-binding protein
MFAGNPRAWGRMNDAQRAIVTEEATAVGAAARRGVQEKEEFFLAEMQKANVAITRPEVGPFRDRMGPAYEQLIPCGRRFNLWPQGMRAGLVGGRARMIGLIRSRRR